MRKLAVVMAVLALAGCENEVEGVHKQVAEHLHNPKTAKFGNVRIDTQGTICGQVRGKDDAGQYEAYRSYVAIKRDGQYDIIVDDTGNNLRIRELCGGADLQRRAEEVPVAMLYNDSPFSVMMASPTDLEDFALGFSMTEGTISDPSQLLRIEVRPSLEGIELAMEVTDSAPIVSMPNDATRNLPCASCPQ